MTLSSHPNNVSLLTPPSNRAGDISQIPNNLAITPGEGVNGVWVEPADHLVTGKLKVWADISSVTPIRIPGYWIHREGSPIAVGAGPIAGEKVVLILHGGGYIRMSSHPNFGPGGAISRGLLKHVEAVSRTFAPEYRLASGEPFEQANPFPAQLLDALAGYNYLVNTVGFDPQDIIVEGDSAGGNLAHALTQYLVDYQDAEDIKLPKPPGALLLICPWVDLSDNMYSAEHGSHVTNSVSDFIGPPEAMTAYAKRAFLGPHGPSVAENNHYISPACLLPSFNVDFKHFPRTFINAGGAEILLDSIKVYRDRMVKELGEGDGVKEGDGKVCYHEMPDGTHDYIALEWFEPERTTSFKEISRWVSAALSPSDP